MGTRDCLPEGQHMLELNRSDRSEIFQDRELMDAVLPKDPSLLRESTGSRLSGSLTHRSITQNVSRPPSVLSQRSTNLSQERLGSIVSTHLRDHDKDADADDAKPRAVRMILRHLLFLCICSLLMTVLSMELLIALAGLLVRSPPTGSISDPSSSGYLVELTTALLTFVIIWNITCFMVFALQYFEVSAILKINAWEHRAIDYLAKSSSIRFIAKIGVFVTVPVLAISVVLFVVIWFSAAAALTAIVIVAVTTVFCVYSLLLSCSWGQRQKKMIHDAGPQETRDLTSPGTIDIQTNGQAVSEMSTLV